MLACAAGVMATWFGLVSSANANVGVGFDPLHGGFTLGGTIVVSVTVDEEAVDLRGFSFVFEFDPSIVTPLAVSPGALLTGASCEHYFQWLNADAVGDSIAVDAAMLGCSVAGPGAIIDFEFGGVDEHYGTSPLRCRRGTMRDSNNDEIPFTCQEGTIDFTAPIPVESSTWSQIKSLYR
jgi:hypothetical protein